MADRSAARGPAVSVIMAVRNGARYVGPALCSVLSQTLQDIEVIVVDDASEDSTPRILAALAATDRRVRVVRNRRRRERSWSRNRAVKLARSALVAVMDHDDIILPDRLAAQHEYLSREPAVNLVGSWWYEVSPEGTALRYWRPPGEEAELRHRMRRTNPFAHASVMFRREAALDAGLYDERLTASEDADFFQRIADRGGVAILLRPLVLKRVDWSREAGHSRCRRWRSLRVRWKWVRRSGALSVADGAWYLCELLRLALPVRVDLAVRRLRRAIGRPELPEPMAAWFRECHERADRILRSAGTRWEPVESQLPGVR